MVPIRTSGRHHRGTWIFQSPSIQASNLIYTKDHDYELGYIPQFRGLFYTFYYELGYTP